MGPQEEAEPFLSTHAGVEHLQNARRHIFHRYQDSKTILSRCQVPKAFTRKQVLTAAGCAILIATVFFSLSRHSRGRPTISNAYGICSTARLNPDNIAALPNPDIPRLTAFWPDLKTALIENGKDLPHLEHPPWMPNAPSDEFIRARTSLISPADARLIRESHAGFVRHMPSYPENTFNGRGIVMLAGGKYSEYAVTALGMLRESGSKLPVEVWRRDEREEKHRWCDEIEQEGMVCRWLSDYLDTDLLAIADGKEMKVLTMLFSSFEEVFFLDADNLALLPPELIFDSEPYRETGVVLWHDYWKYDNIDWLDNVVGISEDRSEALWEYTTFESGQIAWHKQKQWDALLLATYYNYWGPDLYYTLLNTGHAGWGDKDTFPLALRALDKPFHAVPDAPSDAWVSGKIGTRRTGMLQMGVSSITAESSDVNATAAFLHATTVKFSHRAFLCDGCLPIWHTDRPTDGFTSDWEDPLGELYPYLHNNRRFIDPEYLQFMPIVSGQPLDAEIRIWRAMEHAACRSKAWRHARTCTVARRYMMMTFDFRFADAREPRGNTTDMDSGLAWLPGMEEACCLVDPR